MIVARAVGTRGVLALLVLIAIVLVAPRFFVAKPTAAQAESAIRAYWSRQASAEWMPRFRSAPRDSIRAIAAGMGEAIRVAHERQITDLSMRRSIVGPPFGSRWAYIIRFRTPPAAGYEYFRMSRGFAGPVTAVWWTVPLF